MAIDKTPTQGAAVLLKIKSRSAKLRIRRRLRRLTSTELSGEKRPGRDQEQQMRRKGVPLWTWGLLLIICAGLGLCLQLNDNTLTVSGFLESYKNQYHSIVHNRDNYCDRLHRLGNMVNHVRYHVLHQEQAMEQLERALDNTTFQTIALVGSSGVGKSHTALVLREHFPWAENVKTLSWTGARSVRRVQSMLANLVHCGQNLILIDNMIPEDGQYVPVINELIRGREEIANSTEQPHLKQLTVVLIFSLNRLQSDDVYEAELETLKQLPHTHVITYAPLETVHLVDCISREARVEKVQLEDEHVEEIIRGIDARSSGCKSIRSKVVLYGKPIGTDTDKLYPTD
ncbi:uncharacterized protein LOC108048357 [Drosophila rhopaloa]|uniref:Uncharacterized protein LOC108048357 n=1 Tax=Drosophila rhopaloa TaxID=1041015 RepID=A0A6P4FAU2_DRORH|nr:uncharacterized protein LOC108048357 [Drosophila rhopaloa]